MKKFGFATVLAGGLTAAVLGVAAPAGAAPTGPGNAQETINQLQADGYNVIVNRIGTTPLDQATVVAVRPGKTYSRTEPIPPVKTLKRPSPTRQSTSTSSRPPKRKGHPHKACPFVLEAQIRQ
jgi:hypothetical protein